MSNLQEYLYLYLHPPKVRKEFFSRKLSAINVTTPQLLEALHREQGPAAVDLRFCVVEHKLCRSCLILRCQFGKHLFGGSITASVNVSAKPRRIEALSASCSSCKTKMPTETTSSIEAQGSSFNLGGSKFSFFQRQRHYHTIHGRKQPSQFEYGFLKRVVPCGLIFRRNWGELARFDTAQGFGLCLRVFSPLSRF